MKTASLFLRFFLGAALVTTPLAADAKPKKGQQKQRAAQAAPARQKVAKAPQRAARRAAPAPQRQRVAKAPARRNMSKPAPSRSRSAIAQQRRVSPPAKRARPSASQPDRRIAKPQRQQKDLRENRSQNLAAIRESTQRERNARADGIDRADQRAERAGRDLAPAARGLERGPQDRRERDLARTDRERRDRREARVETAQERERRAERVRERERIKPARKQQIAERQERRRERLERFRDNRQRRFAAVQQQRRRAFRAANIAARREYAQEVREEVREYWEDRADEVRDRIRDRRDDLFDDDWWEHRHWHRGPILVSDPWWWWRPARWGSVNLFINAGWSEPVYYDYGTDVIYDEDVVYVRGEPVGTPVEYSRRIVELANPAVPAVAEAPVTEENWQPLGVWALAQEDQGDAVMFFQLSVNREGIISGAYTNVMSGEELPVSGSVDRQAQRAAWHIGDAKEKVFEAGMGNLTQDQASCLVHVGNGETQNWLLVRMPDPKLPDKPATLGQITQ